MLRTKNSQSASVTRSRTHPDNIPPRKTDVLKYQQLTWREFENQKKIRSEAVKEKKFQMKYEAEIPRTNFVPCFPLTAKNNLFEPERLTFDTIRSDVQDQHDQPSSKQWRMMMDIANQISNRPIFVDRDSLKRKAGICNLLGNKQDPGEFISKLSQLRQLKKKHAGQASKHHPRQASFGHSGEVKEGIIRASSQCNLTRLVNMQDFSQQFDGNQNPRTVASKESEQDAQTKEEVARSSLMRHAKVNHVYHLHCNYPSDTIPRKANYGGPVLQKSGQAQSGILKSCPIRSYQNIKFPPSFAFQSNRQRPSSKASPSKSGLISTQNCISESSLASEQEAYAKKSIKRSNIKMKQFPASSRQAAENVDPPTIEKQFSKKTKTKVICLNPKLLRPIVKELDIKLHQPLYDNIKLLSEKAELINQKLNGLMNEPALAVSKEIPYGEVISSESQPRVPYHDEHFHTKNMHPSKLQNILSSEATSRDFDNQEQVQTLENFSALTVEQKHLQVPTTSPHQQVTIPAILIQGSHDPSSQKDQYDGTKTPNLDLELSKDSQDAEFNHKLEDFKNFVKRQTYLVEEKLTEQS